MTGVRWFLHTTSAQSDQLKLTVSWFHWTGFSWFHDQLLELAHIINSSIFCWLSNHDTDVETGFNSTCHCHNSPPVVANSHNYILSWCHTIKPLCIESWFWHSYSQHRIASRTIHQYMDWLIMSLATHYVTTPKPRCNEIEAFHRKLNS